MEKIKKLFDEYINLFINESFLEYVVNILCIPIIVSFIMIIISLSKVKQLFGKENINDKMVNFILIVNAIVGIIVVCIITLIYLKTDKSLI